MGDKSNLDKDVWQSAKNFPEVKIESVDQTNAVKMTSQNFTDSREDKVVFEKVTVVPSQEEVSTVNSTKNNAQENEYQKTTKFIEIATIRTKEKSNANSRYENVEDVDLRTHSNVSAKAETLNESQSVQESEPKESESGETFNLPLVIEITTNAKISTDSRIEDFVSDQTIALPLQ